MEQAPIAYSATIVSILLLAIGTPLIVWQRASVRFQRVQQAVANIASAQTHKLQEAIGDLDGFPSDMIVAELQWRLANSGPNQKQRLMRAGDWRPIPNEVRND